MLWFRNDTGNLLVIDDDAILRAAIMTLLFREPRGLPAFYPKLASNNPVKLSTSRSLNPTPIDSGTRRCSAIARGLRSAMSWVA